MFYFQQSDHAREAHDVEISDTPGLEPIYINAKSGGAVYGCVNAPTTNHDYPGPKCKAFLCTNCFKVYEKDKTDSLGTRSSSRTKCKKPLFDAIGYAGKRACRLDKREFQLITDIQWFRPKYDSSYKEIGRHCMDCKRRFITTNK